MGIIDNKQTIGDADGVDLIVYAIFYYVSFIRNFKWLMFFFCFYLELRFKLKSFKYHISSQYH